MPRNDLEPLGDYAIRIITAYKGFMDDGITVAANYKQDMEKAVKALDEKNECIEYLQDRVASFEKQIEDLASSEV